MHSYKYKRIANKKKVNNHLSDSFEYFSSTENEVLLLINFYLMLTLV